MKSKRTIVQLHQPAGVPPLELTGERTLPDVPQENYWYQRHLVVYQWVAQRVAGRRVADLACGEGYGPNLLATTAKAVVGVDANPQTYEHARLKYQRPNLAFVRELVEDYKKPADTIVFLQTVEHVHEPEKLLDGFLHLLPESGGELIISTPNVLTLAAPGHARSENPWHVKEFRPTEFKAMFDGRADELELYGLFNARKLAAYQTISDRLQLPHDWMHRHDGWAGVIYPPFVHRIKPRDFSLRRVSDTNELDSALDLLAVVRRNAKVLPR